MLGFILYFRSFPLFRRQLSFVLEINVWNFTPDHNEPFEPEEEKTLEDISITLEWEREEAAGAAMVPFL